MALRPPIFSAALNLLGSDCVLCLDRAHDGFVCDACARSLPRAKASEGVVACYEYRFPVDRLLLRFKFSGDLAIGRWLSREFASRVASQTRPDVLVPMPLTHKRLRERGFNQAAQIALAASRALAVPCALRALERTRDAPPQSKLGRRARLANLRGAFRCRKPLHGRHVALVDDVITTGATAHAASQALLRAGAKRVDVWVLARTPRPGEP
jgi:ComF family protein